MRFILILVYEWYEDIISTFDIYRYQCFNIPLVTKWLVDDLRYRSRYVKASFDLGRTFTNVDVSIGLLDIDGFNYYLDFLADELRH